VIWFQLGRLRDATSIAGGFVTSTVGGRYDPAARGDERAGNPPHPAVDEGHHSSSAVDFPSRARYEQACDIFGCHPWREVALGQRGLCGCFLFLGFHRLQATLLDALLQPFGEFAFAL
jgi:hypothetical protein